MPSINRKPHKGAWVPKRRTDVDAQYKERQRIYQSKRWKSTRQLLISVEPLCRYCQHYHKILTPGNEVDHIVPLKHLPPTLTPYTHHNLQVLCKNCHSQKTQAEVLGKVDKMTAQLYGISHLGEAPERSPVDLGPRINEVLSQIL